MGALHRLIEKNPGFKITKCEALKITIEEA